MRTQRRRHPAPLGRKVAGGSVRHRKPIPQRFHPSAYSHQPGPSQPAEVQDDPSEPFDFKFEHVEEEREDEPEDEVFHFLCPWFWARSCYVCVVLIDDNALFLL